VPGRELLAATPAIARSCPASANTSERFRALILGKENRDAGRKNQRADPWKTGREEETLVLRLHGTVRWVASGTE